MAQVFKSTADVLCPECECLLENVRTNGIVRKRHPLVETCDRTGLFYDLPEVILAEAWVPDNADIKAGILP